MSARPSILFIGNRTARSTARLVTAAAEAGVVFDLVRCKDVTLVDGKVTANTALLRPVLDYDTYYFRGIPATQMAAMEAVAAYLVAHGKRVVEERLGRGGLPNDKLVPRSVEGLYEVPQSDIVTLDTLSSYLETCQFPVVAKMLTSSLGRGVAKIDSPAALKAFLERAGAPCQVQTYYDIDFDTRVMVMGDQVIGGFNRYKPEGEPLLTTMRGGRREVAALTPEQCAAAREAARLQGIAIAGIDMFMVGDTIYLLEVNASPQFTRFEKVTGINVAREILQYLCQDLSMDTTAV